MSERRSQRFVLQLGAAFTVTASLSFADIAANAAAPHEKVLALRAAAQSGSMTLLAGTGMECVPVKPERLAQTFDRAPVEKPDGGKLRDGKASRTG